MKKIIIDWSSRTEDPSIISILNVIDENESLIKKNFLNFLYELETEKVGKKNLINDLYNKKGYNFWILSQIYEKNFYKSTLNLDFYKIAAFEIILKKNYQEIKLKNINKKFIPAIKEICKINNTSYSILYYNKDKFIQNIKPPQFLTAIAFLIFNYLRSINAKLNIEKGKYFKNVNNISIFTYFYNFKYLDEANIINFRQWHEIPKKIKKKNYGSINWYHHFIKHQKANNIRSSNKLISKINNKYRDDLHNLILTYLSLSMSVKILILFIYHSLNFKIINFKKDLFTRNKHRKKYWSIFKNDWNSSFHGKVLMQNIIWIELFEKILKKLPEQKIGFFLLENQAWEKILIHAWKKNHHGRIVGFVPNITRYWDLRYSSHSDFKDTKHIQSDNIICFNQITLNTLILMGYEKNKIIKEFNDKIKTNTHRFYTSNQNNLKNKTKEKIIIFGDYEKNINYNFLDTLKRSKFSQNFIFYIKSHPGYEINLNTYKQLNISIFKKEIEDIGDDFIAAIVLGASGAAIDSYLRGLKTLIFFNENDLNYSALKEVKGVNFAYNLNTLDLFLNNYLEKNEFSEKLERLFFEETEQDNWDFSV